MKTIINQNFVLLIQLNKYEKVLQWMHNGVNTVPKSTYNLTSHDSHFVSEIHENKPLNQTL